jgi:hypothetical protein
MGRFLSEVFSAQLQSCRLTISRTSRVYSSSTLSYTTRRQYASKTVPRERVIYCQYIVVNIAFTNVFVNVNGRCNGWPGLSHYYLCLRHIVYYGSVLNYGIERISWYIPSQAQFAYVSAFKRIYFYIFHSLLTIFYLLLLGVERARKVNTELKNAIGIAT